MTQHLSEADVRGIAEYTRIGLDAEEVVAMTADLNAIIDSLAPITEFDLDGVEPTFHPIGDLSNVMRDDEVRGSFTQEVALEKDPDPELVGVVLPPGQGELGAG